MQVRIPTEAEVVLLNDWAYDRDLDRHGCTGVQLETTWGTGWWEGIVRLLGFGLRVTAERAVRSRTGLASHE